MLGSPAKAAKLDLDRWAHRHLLVLLQVKWTSCALRLTDRCCRRHRLVRRGLKRLVRRLMRQRTITWGMTVGVGINRARCHLRDTRPSTEVVNCPPPGHTTRSSSLCTGRTPTEGTCLFLLNRSSSSEQYRVLFTKSQLGRKGFPQARLWTCRNRCG